MTKCFRWFVGLFFLHLFTFWPLVFFAGRGRSDFVVWGIWAALAAVWLATIFFVYRLFRITQSYLVWAYLPFALLPLFDLIALILLCVRSSAELSKLGCEATLFPPRIGAALACLMTLAMGLFFLYGQVSVHLDHAMLKRKGQRIAGTLRMVIKHRTNFIPTGSSFEVEYAGQTKRFSVNRKLLREHTLGDGRFTHHELPVIYLPNRPDVAELPEMLGFSAWSLFPYLIGGVLAYLGGYGLLLQFRKPAAMRSQ